MSGHQRLRKKVPLKAVAFFQEGPGLRTHQWTPEGMKVINVTNILGDGSVEVTNTDKHIALSEFESRYSHFAVENNDIVVASSGNTYGKVGRIRAEHLPLMMNTSVIRFHSLDSKLLDDDFLFAWLRSPEFIGQVEGFVTGGAQPNFGPTHLKQMAITLPEIHVQQAISAILSSYDNLIDNNRRRMALLEESAQLLYREWFISLRFPGHEHTRIIDGVPEGWQRKTLGEHVTLNYGKALKADDRIEGAFPVYGSSGVVGTHEKALVKGPGIIVGRKGNVGSVYWCAEDFYPIDTVYFIEAGASDLYLYYAIKHMHFISTDVAVPGLNRDFAYSRPLLLPPDAILRGFLETVSPIHQQLNKLEVINEKLRAARDLLLPKLMSGEIAV